PAGRRAPSLTRAPPSFSPGCHGRDAWHHSCPPPPLKAWRCPMRRLCVTRIAWLAVTIWSFGIAPAQAQTQVKPGFNIFTVAQDAEIGAQSAAQVDRQMPMVGESAVTRYVSALGAKLAAQAPGPRFNYRFRVANLSDVNAFALPGGYIYVHRGLIENVRSEGELAGVMAHEIAHVALRHPTNQASKAYLAQA